MEKGQIYMLIFSIIVSVILIILAIVWFVYKAEPDKLKRFTWLYGWIVLFIGILCFLTAVPIIGVKLSKCN